MELTKNNHLYFVHKKAQSPKRIPRKQKKSFRKWFEKTVSEIIDEWDSGKIKPKSLLATN